MMDPKQIARQMIKFNKMAFDNTFDTISILQDQIEKAIKKHLEINLFIPAEGKTVICSWVEAYKKSRTEFKTAVDENYTKIEDFFNGQK